MNRLNGRPEVWVPHDGFPFRLLPREPLQWLPTMTLSPSRSDQPSTAFTPASAASTTTMSTTQSTTSPQSNLWKPLASDKPRKHTLGQVHRREEIFLYCLFVLLSLLCLTAIICILWSSRRHRHTGDELEKAMIRQKEKWMQENEDIARRTLEAKEKYLKALQRSMEANEKQSEASKRPREANEEQLRLPKSRPAVKVTQHDGMNERGCHRASPDSQDSGRDWQKTGDVGLHGVRS